MFICEECGEVFSEYEVNRWEDEIGEYCGVPYTEKMSGCPNCKGTYVEAKKCEKCGTWIREDSWDFCEECLNEYQNKENCLDIGAENKDKVKINEFLASAFSEKEIEDILLEHLEKDEEKMASAIRDYCEYDMFYFVEWVKKKWKKEK